KKSWSARLLVLSCRPHIVCSDTCPPDWHGQVPHFEKGGLGGIRVCRRLPGIYPANPRRDICCIQIGHPGDEVDDPHITAIQIPVLTRCVVAHQVEYAFMLEAEMRAGM